MNAVGTMVSILVLVLLGCADKETKPESSGSAAEPARPVAKAEARPEPAKADPPKADPPKEPVKAEPAKPAQRPPPDEAQLRKSLMIAGRTHTPHFSCSQASGNYRGIFDLAPSHIKKMTIAKTTVDGDFAVVEVNVEIRRGLPFSHKLTVVGPVKLRYRWEAEWVLHTRDSTGVTCTES
jgi:hypothetical protein